MHREFSDQDTANWSVWRVLMHFRILRIKRRNMGSAGEVLEENGDYSFGRSTFVTEDRSTFLAIRRRAGGQHELGNALLTANLSKS